MSTDIHQIPSATPDFRTELAEHLSELVPEAITDGKVDVNKLKELLDGDVADSSERFGLFWPGKKRAMRAAQEPTTATLKPNFENSKDWDTTQNVFIEGDNLEVLKILQRHYHGKIKMIYIDPPYNTGKDFVYPDNFKEGLNTYLQWTKQVNEEGKKLSSNSEDEGRYHSNWLNMMYPRLKLARNLLTNDGVIFISIDDNEAANLKRLCDEVFGEANFLSQITNVVKTEGRRYGHFAKTHEYILVYGRQAAATEINQLQIPGKKFKFTDADGGFNLRELRNQNTKAFHAGNRPNLRYPFYADLASEDENGLLRVSAEPKYSLKVEAITVDNLESVWRWGKEKALAMETELVGRRGSDGIIRIQQKVRTLTESPKTVWADKEIISNKGTKEVDALMSGKVFDFPKPVALIKRLVEIGTDETSLILDFFSGSGTTAHAVMQLNAEDGGNRQHIQVQLPEPTLENSEPRNAGYETIAGVARERMHRAGEKIRADYAGKLSERDTPLDIGYRAYKLSDTNFTKWQVSSDEPVNELEQHLLDLRDSANDDASADDLLIELLLKQGHSLNEKIAPVEIAGLELRSVNDGLVLAYLNEQVKPKLDQLRAIAEAKPERLIVLEDAFHGDDELKTNLVQICKTNNIELWTA